MANPLLKEDTPEDEIFVDELKAGSTLMHGQYTIVSFLNAGGFGITYSAKDSLDRRVVIKECFPGAFCRRSTTLVAARSRAHQSELASIVRLFVQEARSLSKLNHPNIVGVHQVFEENNTAYMALDFVEGKDLLEIIEGEGNQLSPDQVETVLRKVLDAVRFIHDQGILHRDISPDNILLNEDNDPILIDFGAAREEASKKSRVLSALRVVKDGYSPQEFYIAGSEQGPYSDLYALGATFYHLITGELPPNSQARLAAVASGEPDPYQALNGRLEGYREEFLMSLDKSLAILPKERIESAGKWLEFMDGVSDVAADTAAQSLTSREAIQANTKSKKGVLLATAASIAVIAVVGLTQTDILKDEPVGPAPVVVADAPAPMEAPVLVDSIETATGSAATDVTDAQATPITDPVTPDVEIAAVAPELSTPVEPQTAAPIEAEDAAKAPEANTSDVVFAAPPTAQPVDIASLEPSEPAVTENVAAPEKLEPVDAEVVAAPDETTPAVTEPITAPQERVVAAPIATEEPIVEAPVVTEPVIAEVAAPERYDVPGMLSGWSPVLPYDGFFSVKSGESRIFSVNGIAVASKSEFDSALRDNVAAPTADHVTVDVRLGVKEETAKIESWTLPIIHKTVFLNGFSFEAAKENDAWVTRVVTVPNETTANIQVGDVLFGHLGSNNLLDTRTALPDLVSRAADGEIDLTFAVMRDGSSWAVSLPFQGLELN